MARMAAALLATLAFSHLLLLLLPRESVGFFIIIVVAQSLVWIPIFSLRARIHPGLALAMLAVVFLISRLRLPHYENDFYRYFWDGLHVSHLRSPYAFSPATSPLAGFDEIRERVGFPSLTTIYSPSVEGLFGALVLLARRSLGVFLWLLTGGGLVASGLALRRLVDNERVADGSLAVLLLLQHPLIALEWYHHAHFDSWVTAALLFGVGVASPFWLGVAANMKLPVAIACAFISRRRYGAAAFALVLLLPWVLACSELPWRSFLEFGSGFEMNSGLFRWVRDVQIALGRAAGTAAGTARIAVLAVWGIIVVQIARLPMERLEKIFWSLFSLVALSPVANACYFTWCLPFAVFLPPRRQILALVALAAVPLSYAFFLPSSAIGFRRVWDVEYAIVYALSAWSTWSAKGRPPRVRDPVLRDRSALLPE